MGQYARDEAALDYHEVDYYYDSHATAEDLMGDTSYHSELAQYLTLVLRWLFRGQVCAIYDNLNHYQTLDKREYPVASDVAVIKAEIQRKRRSWTVGETGPAPQVVFEIASKETWRNDLQEKPQKYYCMGVEEYYLYDPETPQHLKYKGCRLVGWKLNRDKKMLEEMEMDEQGRLWSEQLQSFLVSDDDYLRLYDSESQQRLTEAEAREQHERELEQQTWSLEHKARLFEQKVRQSGEKARQSEEKARQSEEKARLLEEKVRQSDEKARLLAEKLRSLGVNPDEF